MAGHYHKSPEFITEHFPDVVCTLAIELALILPKNMIPVENPAAHHTCGGVMVDEQSNRFRWLYMPLVKPPTQVCTVQTVWRTTPYWSAFV